MIVNGISKSFDGKKVLDNFSAEFEKGKVYCIMGKSGCGKTTLFNIICGLVKADSGTCSDVDKIGAVFQEDRLCERLSAYANVRLVCKKGVSHASIENALLKVGLTDEDIRQPVSELSGGMKRRTAIIRAVLFECGILMMDEPFKGLDSATRYDTIKYILDNANGRTLIVITHDKTEAELLGGELICMG